MDRQRPRQPRAPSCRRTWTPPPQPALPVLALPGSHAGGLPGTAAGRARSLRAAEKVPPPRRRRPRAPVAPQPPRQAKGRGGEPAARGGTVPRVGAAPAAPLPPPGAPDRPGRAPHTHRPSLEIPSWRPQGAARPEPKAGGGGATSRSGETGGGGGGSGQEEAVASADPAQPQQPVRPGALAGGRGGRGFIAARPAPAPSCRPRPRPAPPRLPAASFVCQRAAAPPRPHAGTPPLRPRPRGRRPQRVPAARLRPESAGTRADPEVPRRPRRSCTWVAGIRVCVGGGGTQGLSARPWNAGRVVSAVPSGETGERPGTVSAGPADDGAGSRARGRGGAGHP